MHRTRMAKAAGVGVCALVATISLSVAGPASGQAWIGQIAGQAAAAQAAAQREAACRAGTPASAKDVAKISANMTQLMADYFALSSTSDVRALKRVFAMKTADARWKDPAGETPISALGSRLDAETPTLTLVSSVVGGDAVSARGVWSTPAGGPVYAVDFLAVPGGWRIWHMSLMPAGNIPDTPPAYCHFDPEQAF